MLCKNQLKLPGVIFSTLIHILPSMHLTVHKPVFHILVKYHFHMKQVLKLTCVLNAHLKQIFPFLSLPSTTRLGAEPSAGVGLHHFLQSSSSLQ